MITFDSPLQPDLTDAQRTRLHELLGRDGLPSRDYRELSDRDAREALQIVEGLTAAQAVRRLRQLRAPVRDIVQPDDLL